MHGTTIYQQANSAVLANDWQIQSVEEFNGDGKLDILLRNTLTGQQRIWLMSGATIAQIVDPISEPTTWRILGIGDFNGDHVSDIVSLQGVTPSASGG